MSLYFPNYTITCLTDCNECNRPPSLDPLHTSKDRSAFSEEWVMTLPLARSYILQGIPVQRLCMYFTKLHASPIVFATCMLQEWSVFFVMWRRLTSKDASWIQLQKHGLIVMLMSTLAAILCWRNTEFGLCQVLHWIYHHWPRRSFDESQACRQNFYQAQWKRNTLHWVDQCKIWFQFTKYSRKLWQLYSKWCCQFLFTLTLK